MMLNKGLAIAAQAVSTSWGIQAALNGNPNLLIFEAESEFGGEDAGQRMNQAIADLKMQEGMNKFHERFGKGMK